MDDIADHLDEIESYAKELRHKGRTRAATSVESFVTAYRLFSGSGKKIPKRAIREVLKTGSPVLLGKMVRLMNQSTTPKNSRDWTALESRARTLNRKRTRAKKRGLRRRH